MSDLLSGGIRFTGLASGSDFDEMIDQLKKIEEVQVNRMELWKADWQRRVDAFGEINTEIQNLQSVVRSMDTMTEFFEKTAYSSAETVVDATADTDALEGVYKIEVLQLARNAQWTNAAGFSSKTAKVNTSGAAETFEYTYKGNTRTINVAKDTTLEGLVNLINNDPQNKGVRASLIKNGTDYLLQVRGMDLGDSSQLTITGNTNVDKLSGWNDQPAQSAHYKINDWPPDIYDAGGNLVAQDYLSSETNNLTEVIEGIEFTLKDVGTSQVTIGTDNEKIKENITAFVDAMNSFRTKILEMTDVDENATASDPGSKASQFAAEIGSVLTGNYGVQLLSSRIKQAVAGRASGFDYYNESNDTGDYFSTLSNIGIMTVADEGDPQNGMLRIDEEVLDKALRKDPNAVAELFAAENIGDSDSADFSYYSSVEGITEPGIYDVKYDIDASGNIINAFIDGQAASVDQNTHQLTSLKGNARGLMIQVDNLTAGSYSDSVRLKQGKAGQLDDLLKNVLSEEGTLKIIEKNYEDIMDQIDKKIEREQTRIIRWERNMRLRFARLEETLSNYNGQQQALSSQMNQLANQ